MALERHSGSFLSVTAQWSVHSPHLLAFFFFSAAQSLPKGTLRFVLRADDNVRE